MLCGDHHCVMVSIFQKFRFWNWLQARLAICRAGLNDFALGLNHINNQHAGVDRRNDHKGLPSVAV